jgi:secreted trypsin-like serine protease
MCLCCEVESHYDEDSETISGIFSKVRMHSNREKRMIGGQQIQNGQYPWLVNVRGHIPSQMISYFAVKYSDVYCAGSIIDKRWIVTAAHCFSVPGISTYVSPLMLYLMANAVKCFARWSSG